MFVDRELLAVSVVVLHVGTVYLDNPLDGCDQEFIQSRLGEGFIPVGILFSSELEY